MWYYRGTAWCHGHIVLQRHCLMPRSHGSYRSTVPDATFTWYYSGTAWCHGHVVLQRHCLYFRSTVPDATVTWYYRGTAWCHGHVVLQRQCLMPRSRGTIGALCLVPWSRGTTGALQRHCAWGWAGTIRWHQYLTMAVIDSCNLQSLLLAEHMRA